MTLKQLHAFSLLGALTFAGCASDDTDADGSDTETSGAPSTTETTTETPTSGEPTTGAPTTDDTVDSSGTDDTTSEGDALIRVIHGSPLSPAVDVYVAGTSEPVISGLAYGTASDYLPVPPGDYAFDVRAAGAPADEDPAFTTDTLSLEADVQVSALAAGLLGGAEDDGFRVLALVEGFEDPGEGNAAVRVVHAGSDAPAVGIDVGNDGSVELEGVERFADSGAAGVPLPADTALQVGIVAGGDTVTAFTTPELPAGAELFVIATGLLGQMPREESGFSLLAVSPAGALPAIKQNPRVYAAHFGTDAPNVDICTGGAALLADVPYGAMGGIQVPPGEYPLDIHATGDEDCAGDAAFSVTTPALAAGEQYLAAATGELATDDGGMGPNPAFTVEFYAESFTWDPTGTDASVKVIHAASAPSVTAGPLDDNGEIAESLFQSLSFPNESDEITLPAGEYTVGIAGSRGVVLPATPIAAFDVTAAPGLSAWVVATGSLDSTDGDQDFGLSAIIASPGPWAILPLAAAPLD